MNTCPLCQSTDCIKSGIVKQRQRFKCKSCNYYFTVKKKGKGIDDYYVVKALQLYLEGLSYREIERILGVSHVSVMNWVRRMGLKRIELKSYHPTYKILSASELQEYVSHIENLKSKGLIVTELGDKFMLIQWERFRK